MEELHNCKASSKWFIVDACREYMIPKRSSRLPKISRGINSAANGNLPEDVFFLQSCKIGESSYEDNGNGLFTRCFADALDGKADANNNGELTVLEVFEYVYTNVKKDALNNLNKRQTPTFSIPENTPNFTIAYTANLLQHGLPNKEWDRVQKLYDESLILFADNKKDEGLKLLDQAMDIMKNADDDAPLKGRIKIVAKQIRNSIEERKKLEEELEKERAAIRAIELEKQNAIIRAQLEAGTRKVWTVNGVEFAFRWCPPGTFMMGSPTSEDGRYDNETQHQATLTKGFWMMETEVTQKQWKAVMGNNPSKFKGDDLPVEQVSWNDCQDFCRKCAQRGLPLQLPTEAQWEYACRAGSTTALPNGNIRILGKNNAPALDPIAWYGGNSSQGFVGQSDYNSSAWSETQYRGGPCGTHPVGKKNPNNWGLYDMHGNVWEWCQDWFGDYPIGSVTDPVGPSSGSRRVIRGGNWVDMPRRCRSAYRLDVEPDDRNGGLGFRVVRGQEP